MTSHKVCVLRQGIVSNSQAVYICNWNILGDSQNTGNYDYQPRQLYWAHDNILVQLNTHVGSWISDEEFKVASQKKLNEFLQDLKNNDYEYVEWDAFYVKSPLSNLVEEAMSFCSSTLEVNDSRQRGSNWVCKTEPAICPEYGYQTRTCRDAWNNDAETRETRIHCSPGLCSGCYIPRWFESYKNTCIPYGFRFEHQSGWNKKFYSEDFEDTLVESNHGPNLVVFEDYATITLNGRNGETYNFTLREG